jgi:hypothetical protein
MTSDPELLSEYRRLNRLLFGNSLRSDIFLYWDAMYDDDGGMLDGELSDEIVPGKFVIRINTAFAGWKNQWRIVLAHEMAHLHLWPYEKHGDPWDHEIVRLTKYKSYRKLL